MDKIKQDLTRLFTEAKEKNEFEFICTLINYKGMGSKYGTSNLYEWFEAIVHYRDIFLIETDLKKKTRFGMLLYSTFFESSDFYNILGSLARIVLGYRAAPYLYFRHQNANRWYGTGEKIRMVSDLIRDAGFQQISQFLEEFHFKALRNTFFHSAYSIEDNTYILHESEPITINNIGRHSVDIESFIFSKVQAIIEFSDTFRNEFLTQINSYKEDKQIIGGLSKTGTITIKGSSAGLLGFIDGGSNILLEDEMWMGLNIRFERPSEVDQFIANEILRIFNKDSIRSNDGALEYLAEVIFERNKQKELEDLATIYNKFAFVFKTNGVAESNPWKQQTLLESAISFYDRARNVNLTLPLDYNFGVIKYFLGTNTDNLELIQIGFSEMCHSTIDNFEITRLQQIERSLNEMLKKGIDLTPIREWVNKVLLSNEDIDLKELRNSISSLISTSTNSKEY